MENKLTDIIFGVDCDEVLRPVLSRMVKLYNKWTDAGITEDDVHYFDVEKSFQLVREKLHKSPTEWFFTENEDYIFSCEPLPETVEALNGLYEIGRVIIITSQISPSNRVQTIKWLEKYGFKYDSICFTSKKNDVRCTYLIDDNQLNFDGNCTPIKVLIDAPYNKDYVPGKGTDLMRYNNLTEFYKAIKSNLAGFTAKSFLSTCIDLLSVDIGTGTNESITPAMISHKLGRHFKAEQVPGFDATYVVKISHPRLSEPPSSLVITTDLDKLEPCISECIVISDKNGKIELFIKDNGKIKSYDMKIFNVFSYLTSIFYLKYGNLIMPTNDIRF